MAKINYRIEKNMYVEVEVSEEIKLEYERMEKEDLKHLWREHKRNNLSFEGALENGIEFEDYRNKNPEEILFVRNEFDLPFLNLLTDYQRKIAKLRYYEQRTEKEIAIELGVKQQSIHKILKKISSKFNL